MLDAPAQNWDLYESLTRDAVVAWAQNETPADRLAIYASLFNLVLKQRENSDSARDLHRQHWESKLTRRMELVSALATSDQCRRDRSPTNNPA